MLHDLFGALTSLLSTYFFIRLNAKAWPVGLIATCVNGWLYWQKGIYADMGLELFYFVSLCYGWYRWSSQRYRKVTSIKYLSLMQWFYLSVILLLLYGAIYYLLVTFSHSSIAKLDAMTTALSITAQWLTCHKIMASWVLWFLADILYALMYFYKALPFHTLLALTYTGMAVSGYIYWRKQYHRSRMRQLTEKSSADRLEQPSF